MFNPEEFLNQTIVGENSTRATPIPVGEYTGIPDGVKLRTWVKKDDPSVSGVTLEVNWVLDAPSVAEELGRKTLTVRQGVMLDFTESGALDMGKGRNVQLGRLREALGLNTPGQPFSFNMIVGRPGRVKVTHRVDGESIYAEVGGVTKLG